MRKIRLQMAGRFLPCFTKSGNATYTMAMLAYLKQRNFEMEYLFLSNAPGGKTPWYFVPGELRKCARLRAIDNLSLGPLLIRKAGLSVWVLAILGPIYKKLGLLKKWYRNLRDTRGWAPLERPVALTPHDEVATPTELAFVRQCAAGFRPDVFVVHYAYMAHLFLASAKASDPYKVLITHDCLHQRSRDFLGAGFAGASLDWSARDEAGLLRYADLIVAIQDDDAKTFRDLVPDAEVMTVGLGLPARRRSRNPEPGRCIFVGGGAGVANAQGLAWFLEAVWPRVIASVGHANLHVCGNVNEHFHTVFPNVTFCGRVKSLDPEYEAAEVSIVPLLTGSGLKIKLIEALARGLACVTTPTGIQGVPELRECVMVAESADDFADSIIRILRNPSRRAELEAAALQYTEKRLSPEAVFGPLADSIEKYSASRIQ